MRFNINESISDDQTQYFQLFAACKSESLNFDRINYVQSRARATCMLFKQLHGQISNLNFSRKYSNLRSSWENYIPRSKSMEILLQNRTQSKWLVSK